MKSKKSKIFGMISIIVFSFSLTLPLILSACKTNNTIPLTPLIPPTSDNSPPENLPEIPPTSDEQNYKKFNSPWSSSFSSDNKIVNQFTMEENKRNQFVYRINNEKNEMTLSFQNDQTTTTPGSGIISHDSLLKGILPNEKYVKQSNISYALEMNDGGKATGTTWILDYKLTNDNSYPTTWYFGTNTHVLDNLKIENDKLYPDRAGVWKDNKFTVYNTNSISLYQVNNPQVDEKFNNFWGSTEDRWNKATIELVTRNPDNGEQIQDSGHWSGYYKNGNKKAKTIFLGNDFLKTSPKEFSNHSKWSNTEEYADFAVMELTFDSEEQARKITNNYADNKDNKFKYYTNDFISNLNLMTNNYYVVGYPYAGEDWNLYVNKTNREYEQKNKNGGKPASSPNYNTFSFKNGKSGIIDGAIGMPWFGSRYEYVDNNDIDKNYKKDKFYNTWGLLLSLDNAALQPGASGSLVMDDNGYAIGAFFSSDPTANTGQAQLFYSDGYSYKGYYGNYFLPSYDLIKGGKPLQNSSYFDGLVGWYGKDPNFKTNLFPNGLSQRY